jgi:hypothetical protein
MARKAALAPSPSRTPEYPTETVSVKNRTLSGKSQIPAVKPRKPKPEYYSSQRGKPEDYRECYVELAFNLALLGLNHREMAYAFGVAPETVNVWQHQYPAFDQAIRDGGQPADAKVARALYMRAVGYEHVAEKLIVVGGDIHHEQIVEKFPPDVGAANKWLGYRRGWKEGIEITGKNGGPIQTLNVNANVTVDPVEAARLYQKLIGNDE